MRASDFLGPTGPFASALDGYEVRDSQLRMAEAVEQAITDDGILLVEAGTGTGKTLAYLVPAILSGRRVVISTNTRTLQDQLMKHDIPLLQKSLGVPFKAACMKGVSNYVCQRRLDIFKASNKAQRLGSQLKILQDAIDDGASGDHADISLGESAEIWSNVLSGLDTRIGPRCSYYDKCFVTKMRENAAKANVVVVNHYLFFADLAMRRGNSFASAIPDYDVVIFDEAHQIEDVATSFFGCSVSTAALERLTRDTRAALVSTDAFEHAHRVCEGVTYTAREFFDSLNLKASNNDSIKHPLSRNSFDGPVETKFFALDNALHDLESTCKNADPDTETVKQVARRAIRIRDDLASIAEGRYETRVSWATRKGDRYRLGSSPVDVSEELRDEVFHRAGPTILTSATLATNADFGFVRERLGIDVDVTELQLDSPFDYASQAALYLAGHLPDPRSPHYIPAAAEEIVELIEATNGGAFVLCTSYRAMHAFAKTTRSAFVDKGITKPILTQGEASKSALLEMFKRMHDGVLFATSSFWEGVDVPGDALRLVIIDKLPFDVPSDPLVAARCKVLEESGQHPFVDYLVPAASLALKQGFGRLIRGKKDRGVVAILDSRIVNKNYGKIFLRSLPDASRCFSIDEVKAFWGQTKAPERTLDSASIV